MMEEGKIEAKLDEIHAELVSLRHLIKQQNALSRKEPSRAGDWVNVDYLCQRTSLSRRTILAGKAGTKPLLRMRLQTHPSLWRRSEVDNWVDEAAQRKRNQARARLVRRRKQ